jgi:hypothetical protein
MSFGAAVLLGLALSAPSAPASPVVCTRYSVLAEKNDLAADQDVAAWATAALEKADLFDKASPCFVHVRITAGPIRAGGKQDGWVAHVSASTRRLLNDGKLVTRERGTLFVEPMREGLVRKVRKFVEDFASRLGSPATPLGTDEG